MIYKLILALGVIILLVSIILYINSINSKKSETFSIEDGILSSLCNNKGYVSNLENNRCQCIDGWSGDKCDFSNCSYNGTLSEGVCKCNSGFIGNHCQYSDEITCNGNGKVNSYGKCYCNPNSHGKFCNNICLNGGKGIYVNNTSKCKCKQEKMFFKDNDNTNSAYKMVDLYNGTNCENVSMVKDELDIENLYMNELPSDEKNENEYIFKICPFNKNISIFNMKVNGFIINKDLDDTIKDNNDCYIINPSLFINSYVPDCVDRYTIFNSGSKSENGGSSPDAGGKFEGLCSPIKLSALIGQNVTCTFDVISKNTNKRESAEVTFITSGIAGAFYPGAPAIFGDSNVTVKGLSNFYVRKGIPDTFLSEGSIFQLPFEAVKELHLPHDPEARSYNLIVGEPIDTCSCTGKNCGDDGCGGSCGTCSDGAECNNGICCTPNCSGKNCGDDGCGGSCGTCSDGDACINGICCTPNCSGKKCGDDGCGGSCGTCSDSNGNKLTCYTGPTVNIPVGNKINSGDCICNKNNDPKKDNCIYYKPLIRIGEQDGSKWIIFTNNIPYRFVDYINGDLRELIYDSYSAPTISLNYVPKMKLKDPKNNYSPSNSEPDNNSFILTDLVPPYDNNSYDIFTFNSDKGIYESQITSTIIYQDMTF